MFKQVQRKNYLLNHKKIMIDTQKEVKKIIITTIKILC